MNIGSASLPHEKMLFNRLSPQFLHGIYCQTSLLIWYSGDESHFISKSFITSATLSASYLMAFASWGNGLAGHSSVQLMPSSLEMWESRQSRHLLSLVLMIAVMTAAFLLSWFILRLLSTSFAHSHFATPDLLGYCPINPFWNATRK